MAHLTRLLAPEIQGPGPEQISGDAKWDRLYLGFAILVSLNVMVLSALGTFLALAYRVL